MKKTFPLLLCSAFFATHSANAATPILSVDVQGTDGDNGTETGFVTLGASNFNTLTDTSSTNLTATQSGVTLTINSGIVSFFNQGGSSALSGDVMFLNVAGTSASVGFEISGLSVGQEYQITSFAGQVGDRDLVTTIGSESTTVVNIAGGGPSSASMTVTAVDDGGGNGILTGIFTGGPGGQAEGNLGGIQVSLVPEPSASALLGIGGLTLILRRRK
jgi:hypothetical protein